FDGRRTRPPIHRRVRTGRRNRRRVTSHLTIRPTFRRGTAVATGIIEATVAACLPSLHTSGQRQDNVRTTSGQRQDKQQDKRQGNTGHDHCVPRPSTRFYYEQPHQISPNPVSLTAKRTRPIVRRLPAG